MTAHKLDEFIDCLCKIEKIKEYYVKLLFEKYNYTDKQEIQSYSMKKYIDSYFPHMCAEHRDIALMLKMGFDYVNKKEVISLYKNYMGNLYTYSDVSDIIISDACLESYPCQHSIDIIFNDGYSIKGKIVSALIIYDFLLYLNKNNPHFDYCKDFHN
jgi:hypothetical protein